MRKITKSLAWAAALAVLLGVWQVHLTNAEEMSHWVHNCGNVAFQSGAQVYDPLLGEGPIWAINTTLGYPEVRDDEWTEVVDCVGGPNPSIDVEKLVSLDSQVWNDADDPTGPEVVVGQDVWFRFVVTNTGDASLTGVTLNDSAFDLDTCSVPSVFTPDGTIDCTVGPFEAERGQHSNTATAAGDWDGESYNDQDSAHYIGVAASMDVEKALGISYTGSWQDATWYDADSPPGPVVDTSAELWFRFAVTNTGDVALTDVLVNDSDFNLVDYGCSVPSVFASGAVSECVIGPFAVETGSHANTVTAAGYYEGQAYTDEDSAHYFTFTPTGLLVSPTSVTVTVGSEAIFGATVEDSYGTTWDVTDETVFSIDATAGGVWAGNVYTSEVIGTWAVTGQYHNLIGGATVRAVFHTVFLPLVAQGHLVDGAASAAR